MNTPAQNLAAAPKPRGITRWLPALRWLPSYQRGWLRPDLVAGLTLAAYLLPAGLGDASLANLPPQAGIYACLFSGLVFWLFCSSRHTAITVTSAISMLLGASLGEMAGGDPSRFGDLAVCAALLVAVIGFVAWAVRAGTIVNFISESVMIGFKCGVGLFLASSQLPKLFGFGGSHGGGFWARSGHFIRHIHQTNRASLMLGLIALSIIVLGKIFLKKRPVALFVVIGGIVAAAMFSLDARGVKLLGEVPRGLPHPRLPAVTWAEVNDVLPLAFACFLLGAVETVAVGRMFVAKHGGRLNSNQELLGLAMANLAAGIGQGFPVSGGMSQSLVNESGGARTPLSGFVGAVIILLVALFLSGPLRYLPQPVLAAIVLAAVAGLVKVDALRRLWKTDRSEFITAMAALLGVLGAGLLHGVLIGAFISLVLILRRASRPHVARLGRIPGTRRFSDRQRHPDNELIADVAIFRPESGLVYFNIDHMRQRIVDSVHAAPTLPKLVILDLSAAPHVDVQGAQVLGELAGELTAEGIRVQAVEARSSVRDRLRAVGVDAKLGGINRFSSIADVLDAAAVAAGVAATATTGTPPPGEAAELPDTEEACNV